MFLIILLGNSLRYLKKNPSEKVNIALSLPQQSIPNEENTDDSEYSLQVKDHGPITCSVIFFKSH